MVVQWAVTPLSRLDYHSSSPCCENQSRRWKIGTAMLSMLGTRVKTSINFLEQRTALPTANFDKSAITRGKAECLHLSSRVTYGGVLSFANHRGQWKENDCSIQILKTQTQNRLCMSL